MVRTWIVHVDLPEPSHRVTDELRFFLEKAQAKSQNLTLDFAFERDLGARRRHTATFGSPTGAKPRVMVFQNLAVISLSPTLAGRDATSCRL